MFAAKRILIFLLCTCCFATSYAGGSFVPVKVKSLTITNEVSYSLLIAPEKNDDPYFSNCKEVRVTGKFENERRVALGMQRPFPDSVTRKRHLAALSMLDAARKDRQQINFGWMGAGLFPSDAKKPCNYLSRALEIFGDRGTTAILSYHEPT
jgi:hypothetical protein